MFLDSEPRTGRTHINQRARFPRGSPGEGPEDRDTCRTEVQLGRAASQPPAFPQAPCPAVLHRCGMTPPARLLDIYHSCPLKLVFQQVPILQLSRNLLEPRETLSALSQDVPIDKRASPSRVGLLRLPRRWRCAGRLNTSDWVRLFTFESFLTCDSE